MNAYSVQKAVPRTNGAFFLLLLGGLLWVILSTPTTFAETNLLQNGDFETPSASDPSRPADWEAYTWGNNDVTFSYPVAGESGAGAFIRVNEIASGDAKWGFKSVLVTAGETYLYRDSYKSSTDTKATAEFEMADGSYSYQWIGHALNTNGTWNTFEGMVDVPEDAVSMIVYHIIDSEGTLTIDNVSLENSVQSPPAACADGIDNDADSLIDLDDPGCTDASDDDETDLEPDPTNLLQNGDFETPSASDPSRPADWEAYTWGNNDVTFSYPVAGESGAGAQVTISQYVSGDAKWQFSPVATIPGTEYEYHLDYLAGEAGKIVAEFEMTDGSYSYQWIGNLPKNSSWQTFDGTLTIPANVASFSILAILQQVGNLSIDNARLFKTGDGNTSFTEGMITLNFDDGTASIYEYARPILNAANIKSTQNIITQKLGINNYFMTWSDVETLYDEGHEIGSHTRTHPYLTELTLAEAQDEIEGSKTDLTNHGINTQTFVYPYADFDSSITDLVKDAGFIGTVGLQTGLNTPQTDTYDLRSYGIKSDTTFAEVQNWIDTAVAQDEWLILFFHEQVPGGSSSNPYSNDPALLQDIVDYTGQSDITAVTMTEGINLME